MTDIRTALLERLDALSDNPCDWPADDAPDVLAADIEAWHTATRGPATLVAHDRWLGVSDADAASTDDLTAGWAFYDDTEEELQTGDLMAYLLGDEAEASLVGERVTTYDFLAEQDVAATVVGQRLTADGFLYLIEWTSPYRPRLVAQMVIRSLKGGQ